MGRPEDKYVKLPAVIHATRLGYSYHSIRDKISGLDWDADTNIFYEQFKQGLEKVNGKQFNNEQIEFFIQELKIKLNAEDIGRAFFKALQKGLGDIKLIDFENSDNNLFHVVTELPYVCGDDSFRPDITFLINGMPLAFMEAKRQNNKEGILAERARMATRFSKSIYRNFVNITQLMVFSNNQEYDDEERLPIHGSFYASSAYGEPSFSRFREERSSYVDKSIANLDDSLAKHILRDNGLAAYFGSAEYHASLQTDTPANRIITSLLSKERIIFLLKYGLCYVEKVDDNGITKLEKHIMRYPQLFATLAVRDKLNDGVRQGIIWHTQGSGKTALAFLLTRYLKDYFQKHHAVAQFFFIVDRDSLAEQAIDEFSARGLSVLEVNSRKEFNSCIQNPAGYTAGEDAIMVVNVQKFDGDTRAIKPDYNINVQRVYFVDEAHRDYSAGGAYLTNMMTSDPNAIRLALTGTPLVNKKDGYNSRDIFGNYIHTYYYNQSIADGYTLRLIREEIQTTFKEKMKSVLDTLKIIGGEVKTAKIYEHPNYVDPLVEYIVNDYLQSQIALADNDIGAMIVAYSAQQAREIYTRLQELEQDISSALVLYDEGTVSTRKVIQRDYKTGSIDILVVFNMLLTGFDASRLKKLYLCRVIEAHNLLQCLTRVNRPYKDFSYGYIVDFAGIEGEFDKTNQAYFKELQTELGDDVKLYSSLFEDPTKIAQELQMIKTVVFEYDTANVVNFIKQIDVINNKEELYKLRSAMQRYRELHNIVKVFGYEELLEKFDLIKASELLNEVDNRINAINLKEALAMEELSTGNLNIALQNIEFHFNKIKEEELHIADEFEDKLRKTYTAFAQSLDQDDPEYILLMNELREKFKRVNIEELTGADMKDLIADLDRLKQKIDGLNNKDANLCQRYGGDEKFLRIHKTMLRTPPPITTDKLQVFEILSSVKALADDVVENNESILDNESYFREQILSIFKQSCAAQKEQPSYDQILVIGQFIAEQYQQERRKAS